MVVKAEVLQIKIIYKREKKKSRKKLFASQIRRDFVIDLNSKVSNYQHMNGRVNVVSIRTFQLEIYILGKKIKMKNK